MKQTGLAFVLLLFIPLCLWTQTKPTKPTITIQASSIKVGDLLAEITRQSGLNFSFNSRVVDIDAVVSFYVRDAPVEDALEALGSTISVAYTIIENQIVLNFPEKKEPEKYYTLSGFIRDRSTGEHLIGATVAIAGTASGVVTNAFGYFALQLQAGKHELHCSYVGFELGMLAIEIKQNKTINVALKPVSIALPSVIVDRNLNRSVEKKDLGQIDFSANILQNMPEFGGESGLVKGLQSLPGIKMHSDGSAFMYARGGERDQNLIIIDDAPIYNPSHLFGFYSLVVPDFTKSIQVYKSDMPASLGDRLSSIISIRTKDGNLNQLELNGAVNPLMYRFALEAPVSQNKGSIFTSFRRSNFEWLYRESNPGAKLFFGDFNFKWNHKVNNQDRIYFTTILSGDNFTTANGINEFEDAGIRWGNFAASLRWNHIFGPRLFSNTTLYTGNYGYRLFSAPNYWQSSLATLGFKSDFTHYISPRLKTKFGLELQGHFIDPGSFSLDSTIAVLPEITANYSQKLGLYYQGHFNLTDQLKINAGLRVLNWSNSGPATYYSYGDQYQVVDTTTIAEGIYNNYFNIDPRLSIEYAVSPTSQLKFSYGHYHQYLQLISNSISPFNSLEIWLPSGPNLRPQFARQWALNLSKYFQKPELSFSTALYYKQFRNQVEYKNHANILLNPFLEGELCFGTMETYGIEFLLKKEFGRLNGWATYTYSRALRKTPGINNDQVYPAFQDRPHDFSLLLNYQWSKRLLLSTYWTIFSGSTFSAPTGFYTFNDQTVPIYDEKNNDRLPTYNRVDFSIKYLLNKDLTRRFQHSLTFSVYNALAHRNVISVNFNKIPSEGPRPLVKADFVSREALNTTQLDLIRFFPSLTYKFKY